MKLKKIMQILKWLKISTIKQMRKISVDSDAKIWLLQFEGPETGVT